MDWKETMMKPEVLQRLAEDVMRSSGQDKATGRDIAHLIYRTAEAQAQITGDIACKVGEKEGVRKVVKWVEKQRMAGKTLIQGVGYGVAISDEKWQAYLKSLEEGKEWQNRS